MGFIRYLKDAHKVSVIYLTIVLIVLLFFLEPSNLSRDIEGNGILVVIPFSLLFLSLIAIGFILVKVETRESRR